MPRSRVLSFMSQWGGNAPRSPTSEASPSTINKPPPSPSGDISGRKPLNIDTATPQASATKLDLFAKASPGSPSTPSRARGDSRPARPTSMLQTYNPPQVEVAPDTPPELQPIFSYLNSHSNKLYQEGYFLKLHDLDSRGRPSPDRVWNECFAQLVGTVLSLWDAAALDIAGEDGEVVPTFVNLSDASIKMIESLPMNGAQGGNLQNVLSISTAANNRYLLHFNSLNSLTQWTAGIRLAMFEHATLQEAYTGSLIAGKGRYLNNIKQIMFRSQFQHMDWARVRFGAGTAWRRCWCVITPPDEKEYARAQKTLKKNSAYERMKMPKGDIKFYDTRKVTKKTRPIATISDAYAAYAIYPQSKPLIDQSTLVKLEGLVTIHGSQESTTEGFVFVMPEVHAAVTGFEMMLRWLFPVFDTFNLYGRPNKLIADTLDQRGLMFALPKDRRYGYLDTLDVSSLIHTKGSPAWSERQWRREMKKLTSERMTNQEGSPASSRHPSQRRYTASRASLPPSRGAVRFGGGEEEYIHSSPGSRSASPGPMGEENRLPRTDSAPPGGMFSSPHKRSASDAVGYKRSTNETPSRLSYEMSRPAEDELPPPPPRHGGMLSSKKTRPSALERIESESAVPTTKSYIGDAAAPEASPLLSPPAPVGAPPALTHQPNSRPTNTPMAPPELRRAHSNVDAATLYQMQDAVRTDHTPDDLTPDEETWNGEIQQRQQNTVATQPYANRSLGVPADRSQGVANRYQRDPRQRLSTIPGSPYVGGDAESFQSPTQAALPQMDGVVEERPPSNDEAPNEPSRPAPPVPIHSSHSIARKPVPKPLPQVPMPQDGPPPLERSMSDPTSPGSVTHTETWEGDVIDEDALERILNGEDRNSTMRSSQTQSTEPDYASTADGQSVKGQKVSIERPRAGKLKTVGDPDMPVVDPRSGGAGRFDTWSADQVANAAEVPPVDFGPTYAYKPNPNSRPGTSGTLTPGEFGLGRSKSADPYRRSSRDGLTEAMTPSSIQATPVETNRHSYFGSEARRTPSPGRIMPEAYTPGGSALAWQPGASPGSSRNRNSVSAEEWVSQRAAMAQQAQYAPPRKTTPTNLAAHGRSNSVQPTRKLTKTPPLGRTLSGDWTQAARRTPPPRPQSRGAGIGLDAAAASLSAREQMQVSRATGTPLISMESNSANQQQAYQQPGLIGTVAQRERDKAAMKEGRNSVAVQAAIIERQQQQARKEAEAQGQQQYQMQVQAAQAAQAQQFQQQMTWNKMALAQNAAQLSMYGQQHRPAMQSSNSWQYGQQAPQGYNALQSPAQYGYAPNGAPYGQVQRAQTMQNQPPQQPYGASYLAQQQQGGQAQQWGRR